MTTLNKCLEKEKFLSSWKRARITLLRKERSKPVDEPSSYRPIFLLDGTGKLLERMIFNRIADQVTRGLAPNQFGFRQEMGTVEAKQEMLEVATSATAGVVRNRQLYILVTPSWEPTLTW